MDEQNNEQVSQSTVEGLRRQLTPEQYKSELRSVYTAVGLITLVFVLILSGVCASWV